MNELDVEFEAYRFLDGVFKTLLETLPLEVEDDLDPTLEYNKDTRIAVGEFVAPPVHGAGQPQETVGRDQYSQLFKAIIRYELSADRSEKFLAVQMSKYELRVATAPGIRFEYERDYKNAPCAHIHYSGVAGLLSPALMQNFQNAKNRRKKGRLEDLHLPVGGKRFRPSLEDFLYFLIAECGFRGKPGWEQRLLHSRQEWLERQAAAAARDFPFAAAAALEALGFNVCPPEGFQAPADNAQW